eukprot:10371582-Alexandrium_andersonii.AAC.1
MFSGRAAARSGMPAGLGMRHPEPSFMPMVGDGPRDSTRPGHGEGSCRPPFCACLLYTSPSPRD